MKVIDIDKLFDKYIEGYVYANIGKIKPEEIENKIPVLYTEFGDSKQEALDGKTPNEYYKGFSASELLDLLKEHLIKEVSVSDFLCEAITSNKSSVGEIVSRLNKDESNSEYIAYLMNMLNDLKGEIPYERYIEFALYDYPDTIGELATEFLCEKAQKVKDKILEVFEDAPEDKKPRLLEILSNTKDDDRVFKILTMEFSVHTENFPLYAQFLAKFGDDRAIDLLKKAMDSEKISYADYEELRFSVEALGGYYDPKRDFSFDKTYKAIKGEAKK